MRIASSFAAYVDSAKMGTVKIVFTPVFDSEKLELGSKQYRDAMGDSLYIDLFRFYVGEFSFGKSGDFHSDIYHDEKHNYKLVDAEDEQSWTLTLPVPVFYWDDLVFTSGVDSALNTTGAMSGDLDPVKGMYWAWNTGYIMAKLEGRSKSCATLHHAFEFHIGGYAAPYNTVRNIALPWPIDVKEGKTTVLHINVNVAAWFKEKGTPLDLHKINDITTPGKDAMQMADRYMMMFEPVKVTYE